VVDTLVDGTFSDGRTGMFRELYDSLLEGASWHRPDNYFLLRDFLPYCDARMKVNSDYRNREAFARKCILNIAASGPFTSDRTIKQYSDEIWKLTKQD
jgi:starch phosphorylase